MLADSPVRVTVTTVPSTRVSVIEPSGSGTRVSALAAPAEKNPRAMAAALPALAILSPRRRLFLLVFMNSPLRVQVSGSGVDWGQPMLKGWPYRVVLE
ncbi:hypothetical protein BTZ20_3294 [Rhodococcus sp. MTM3W5.2]|nr:hypothetical protein BTZ20_3294 [Rhodococcus sp. MTM3W5.2]